MNDNVLIRHTHTHFQLDSFNQRKRELNWARTKASIRYLASFVWVALTCSIHFHNKQKINRIKADLFVKYKGNQ